MSLVGISVEVGRVGVRRGGRLDRAARHSGIARRGIGAAAATITGSALVGPFASSGALLPSFGVIIRRV